MKKKKNKQRQERERDKQSKNMTTSMPATQIRSPHLGAKPSILVTTNKQQRQLDHNLPVIRPHLMNPPSTHILYSRHGTVPCIYSYATRNDPRFWVVSGIDEDSSNITWHMHPDGTSTSILVKYGTVHMKFRNTSGIPVCYYPTTWPFKKSPEAFASRCVPINAECPETFQMSPSIQCQSINQSVDNNNIGTDNNKQTNK
ncbi:hypothetical protein B9Z19DRAFT_1435 [Tuber borchii]|uniref:Uncharacterized protein n=1 Tax=Tuber borchii TaxID=42251 RepID=A0A2T7A9A5_TUBBO|nr:hypothetical protein B9Z19DRAFT_1435 [Tuber borchii]